MGLSCALAVKNLMLEIQDGGQQMRLRPVKHHHKIPQFFHFQDGGRLIGHTF